jgi:hypothetical protein
MVVKFRNTICPPQPQLSLHRRAALSSNSNGTFSYIAERTQSAVYIVRCLWCARNERKGRREVVFEFFVQKFSARGLRWHAYICACHEKGPLEEMREEIKPIILVLKNSARCLYTWFTMSQVFYLKS